MNNPHFNEIEAGVYWFHLVRPSVHDYPSILKNRGLSDYLCVWVRVKWALQLKWLVT